MKRQDNMLGEIKDGIGKNLQYYTKIEETILSRWGANEYSYPLSWVAFTP